MKFSVIVLKKIKPQIPSGTTVGNQWTRNPVSSPIYFCSLNKKRQDFKSCVPPNAYLLMV